MFPCPNCEKNTISLKSKLLAGYWKVIFCPSCNARLSAHPIFLPLLNFVYVWDVFWFFGLYYLDRSPIDLSRDPIYFVYMVIGWILLDLLNLVLIPLAIMKRE